MTSGKVFLQRLEKFIPEFSNREIQTGNPSWIFQPGNSESSPLGFGVTADISELYTNLRHDSIFQALHFFGTLLADPQTSPLIRAVKYLFKYAHFPQRSMLQWKHLVSKLPGNLNSFFSMYVLTYGMRKLLYTGSQCSPGIMLLLLLNTTNLP